MSGHYILGIDQSTAGTKALVFNGEGVIVSRRDKPHEQKVSDRGWVSHDPEEIYRNTLEVCADAVRAAGIDAAVIAGIGISNQRETALVWERKSGRPVYDAVVWQCARGEALCKAIAGDDAGAEENIRRRTGLRLSPYFSAAKIAWILEHAGRKGDKSLCAGTMDSWLIYKLTGSFKTDYSNASRTQLFNSNSLQWDDELCRLFSIDRETLAEVCDSNSVFGETDLEGLLPKPAPVHAAMGDSHAALFGQGCLEKGMGKVTYGTGSSVMINSGETPEFCRDISTSLAWGINGKVDYVLEGNINYSGAVIKWLIEDLGLIGSAREAASLAAGAHRDDTTYLVPAFSGLGAPHWKADAKASLTGMTRATGKAEIVKAAEESIAYQIADVVNTAREEAGIELLTLRADGGATRDEYLMQFQSDILNLPLEVSENEELSAIGAAWMAGMALGLYPPALPDTMKRRRYIPAMDAHERERRLSGWREAVAKALC
ncbi:MAG: glycerol kinase GlpK [Spirochaetaceae bacterium]|jgi:glycerol kinase|nr:glycerol kinase GlpK [Spirochaetaceae bacterium]